MKIEMEADLSPSLERNAAVELNLSAAYRDSSDLGGLAGPDGIISGLAKAGMVQDVPGIGADLQLDATIRPDIECLAERGRHIDDSRAVYGVSEEVAIGIGSRNGQSIQVIPFSESLFRATRQTETCARHSVRLLRIAS